MFGAASCRSRVPMTRNASGCILSSTFPVKETGCY